MPMNSIPEEYRRSFNASVSAIIVYEMASAYSDKTKGKGIPSSLLLIGYPLAIDSRVLQMLPNATKFNLPSVIEKMPELTIGFAKKAQAFSSFAVNGLLFCVSLNILSVNSNGEVFVEKKIPRKKLQKEVAGLAKTARAIGNGFGRLNDCSTIYSLLGVCP